MGEIKEIKTVDHLKATYPDLTRQIEEAATAAERQRIQDIEDVSLPGFEAIVAEAKFTKPVAAGDVARAIVAEQRKRGEKYIRNRDDDAKNSGAGGVAGGAGIEGMRNQGSTEEIDAVLDKLFPAKK